MALKDELIPPLTRWLEGALGARAVRIERMEKLGGGAIQENWGLDVRVTGGRLDGRHALVLRTDAPSRVAVSWDRAQEFRILEVAFRAGVAVPEPVALCEDEAVIGKVFYLMRRAEGEARGHKLVRDPAVRAKGEALAARLGAELAKLHRVRPPVPELAFIPVPDRAPALWRVEEYRRHLDALGAKEPVLEWALTWLERHAPQGRDLCLVHADFRTGNYLVSNGELTAVLDWEFAGFSDPLEDLGWMLAKYWRFGSYELEAGGIGSREALFAGYEAEAGHEIDRAAVPYWEVMATVRWAVIALMQAARHFEGQEDSLELALTAHVLPVLELDLLTRVREIEETSR
ncbi:phosphotransferase family protein [Benzoatithermus flavus]|uniref:Phosphotransferase family protein n=1 Tax=Benzoatithermus flavus TaxID=3108223 RepID=A0ABU8XSY4_9PROT